MRTLLLATAAIGLLASGAQAQVICQPIGDNMMCSNGTIIYGSSRSTYPSYTPRSYVVPPQSGEFAFGQGLTAGRGALESHSRQQLLNQQTEQLRLQNQLLQQQMNTTRQAISRDCTTPGQCSDMVARQNNEVMQRRGGPPGCRPSGANTFRCD